MYWLLFELAAPLASFGGVAPGTIRDTDLVPSRSAVLGLLAAAMGIERADADRQKQLSGDLLIAARVSEESLLLRDYHTAQAPVQSALKGRPCRSRRDELAVPKKDLNTVVSERYYYTTYAATIGVVSRDGDRLEVLEQGLRQPVFALYAGRKSCPLAWPLDPHRLEADSWAQALEIYDRNTSEKLGEFHQFGIRRWLRPNSGRYVHRVDDGLRSGELPGLGRQVVRRDEPLDVSRRLFGDCRHWRFGREVAS
jgi:CRISPR system Cascade subunit CasD